MEKLPLNILLILVVLIALVSGCRFFIHKKAAVPFESSVIHPGWSENSVLYEVNIRQYTPEGTLKAFEAHLPRLKDLGVDVLWLMPTYPIGIKNKKGELGSYYSVRDYKGVNPAFGTLDDLKKVFDKAHELGMKVMLDWVPNHTSWDNNLTVEHPDWYMKDSKGNFIPPLGFDWTDVIQLDWSKKELQDYMLDAMKYWVELGADGFRVDHPHNTPKEFWERARAELSSIKPVLMLAEIEETRYLEKGFDMNYAWEMHHLMNRIAQGKDSVKSLAAYYRKDSTVYPRNVYRMQFLTNHDENSWAGTIDSLMGDAQKAFATLIFTGAGVPLIYSGQEVCLNKKLRFFERDTIKWDSCNLTGFYQRLILLKKQNAALWNGEFGGPMVSIPTNKERKVFAFYREKDDNRVLVFLNLSRKSVAVKPSDEKLNGEYNDYFTGGKIAFPLSDSLLLEPWGYRVMVR